MPTNLTRRGILKALGIGAAALAAEPILEPARKLWFVPSNAPVGSRIERLDRVTARTWSLKLDVPPDAPDDPKQAVLEALFKRCRSQKDLEDLRIAAKFAETLFVGKEREELIARLQGRVPGGIYWDHDYDTSVATVILT